MCTQNLGLGFRKISYQEKKGDPACCLEKLSALVASEVPQRVATCVQGPLPTPNYAVWGQRARPRTILFYFNFLFLASYTPTR